MGNVWNIILIDEKVNLRKIMWLFFVIGDEGENLYDEKNFWMCCEFLKYVDL